MLISAVKPAFDLFGFYPEAENNVKIELHMEEAEKAEPGEDAVLHSPYIENSGTEACYVRVKIDLPRLEGKSVLELGKYNVHGFSQLKFSADESQSVEYWEIKEDYIYYRNRLTDNRLMPGKITPPIYEAVRFSPEISEQGQADSEQSCVVYAQAASAENGRETEAWQKS